MADRRTLLSRFAAMGIAIPSAGAAVAQHKDTVEVPVATLVQIASLLERIGEANASAKRRMDTIIAMLEGKLTPQEAKALLT